MNYVYGMRLRGCSPGAQPKGFTMRKDDKTGKYYDLLIYPEKLDESELYNYDLDYLGDDEYGD